MLTWGSRWARDTFKSRGARESFAMNVARFSFLTYQSRRERRELLYIYVIAC